MSINLQSSKDSLALVERGLNKASLKGSFELNESFLLKTALNTLSTLVKDLEKSNTFLATFDLDPIYRCLSMLEQGLRKGNLKGCFELDESYTLKENVNKLNKWWEDLKKESKTVENQSPVKSPQKKAQKPLPKVEEVVQELRDGEEDDE